MFGMSMTELMIVAVIGLILIGPDELPKAARTVGTARRRLSKTTEEERLLLAVAALVLVSFAAGYLRAAPGL
jgi:hypothetical protein